jgi:putative Mg2+ transporter-C (MgtC) family protein
MPDWLQRLGGSDTAFIVHLMGRLILAAILGGAIGLEREVKHKPAGLRTNMFICMGSALFTLLSDRLAAGFGGDHTRIAAQIIPGIGFIGAGSILHSRGSVTGLTTAATLFVVASIGMATGGGLYVAAIFATLIVGIALQALGWFETQFNLKPLILEYVIIGHEADAILADVNAILDDERKEMQSVRVHRANGDVRVHFSVEATRREQDDLFDRLRHAASTKNAEQLPARGAE